MLDLIIISFLSVVMFNVLHEMMMGKVPVVRYYVYRMLIFPVVYFFYPETAYRSLEEIDTIFRKTKGWFTVVSTAKHEPLRYGKNGELLIDYEQTEEHAIRSHSVVSQSGKPASRGAEHVGGSGETSSSEGEKREIV